MMLMSKLWLLACWLASWLMASNIRVKVWLVLSYHGNLPIIIIASLITSPNQHSHSILVQCSFQLNCCWFLVPKVKHKAIKSKIYSCKISSTGLPHSIPQDLTASQLIDRLLFFLLEKKKHRDEQACLLQVLPKAVVLPIHQRVQRIPQGSKSLGKDGLRYFDSNFTL